MGTDPRDRWSTTRTATFMRVSGLKLDLADGELRLAWDRRLRQQDDDDARRGGFADEGRHRGPVRAVRWGSATSPEATVRKRNCRTGLFSASALPHIHGGQKRRLRAGEAQGSSLGDDRPPRRRLCGWYGSSQLGDPGRGNKGVRRPASRERGAGASVGLPPGVLRSPSAAPTRAKMPAGGRSRSASCRSLIG